MFVISVPGIVLCMLMRAAQRRQRRLAFHCPIHGDFYPLSPQNSRKYSRKYMPTKNYAKSRVNEQVCIILCEHRYVTDINMFPIIL